MDDEKINQPRKAASEGDAHAAIELRALHGQTPPNWAVPDPQLTLPLKGGESHTGQDDLTIY